MRRRRYLQVTAATTVGLLAGCLGDDESTDTALDPANPDIDGEALGYPTNGEVLPSVELPAPLHDTTVATDGFVDERETLLTFIFTRCPGPCLTMTNTLAQVQLHAMEHDIAEEVALMPVTFDPEHDTPAVLETFCESQGADPHHDSWYALRPESPERASDVVDDTFGVSFEEVPMDESDHGDHGDHDHDSEMTFIHTNLIVLANRDGIVEQAYFGDPPAASTVIDDLETVRAKFA